MPFASAEIAAKVRDNAAEIAALARTDMANGEPDLPAAALDALEAELAAQIGRGALDKVAHLLVDNLSNATRAEHVSLSAIARNIMYPGTLNREILAVQNAALSAGEAKL